MNGINTDNSIIDKAEELQLKPEDWYESLRKATTILEGEAKKAGLDTVNGLLPVHDICTKDVRALNMKTRTITQTVPCNPDGSSGCRGGLLPEGAPTVESIRIICADERLSPETGCDRIINNVEFEVVLRYGSSCYLVLTPSETFPIYYNEFYKFPSLQPFTTLDEFKNELKVIDGSCKAIQILRVGVRVSGNDCILTIVYNVYDKLWKYENLMLLAEKLIPNSTIVCDVFQQGHEIGPCVNGAVSPCCG